MSSISPMTTCSPAARAARGLATLRQMATDAIATILVFIRSSPSGRLRSLYAEELVQLGHFGLKCAGRETLDDPAALHHVEAVGQRCGEAEILLHHDDGVALLSQLVNGARERLDDHRREALGDLIEEQQPCPGAQNPGQGEHLLL